MHELQIYSIGEKDNMRLQGHTYLFSENNLQESEKNPSILESIKKEQEKLINYLQKLLSAKPEDVREYLKNNPFNN